MAHVQSATGDRAFSGKAVFWSGLGAGVVFLLPEMIPVALVQGQSSAACDSAPGWPRASP